jgi:hypothetical protein
VSERSRVLVKSLAALAGVAAIAYAWLWTLGVTPSLRQLPGVRAGGWLPPVVLREPSESTASRGGPIAAPVPAAAAVTAATMERAPTPGGGRSRPVRRVPAALRPPGYPSGYIYGGEISVVISTAPAVLERRLAVLSAGRCRDFGRWEPVEAVNMIPDGTCARYRAVADDAGERLVATAKHVVRRDDTPPLAPRLLIAESTENAYAAGDALYYRAVDGEAGTFTLSAVAEDPESGVAELALPALGDTAPSTSAGREARGDYEWSASSTTAEVGAGVATNGAGLQSEATLQFVGDADAPAGGFVSYQNGLHRDGSVHVSYDAGDDAGSGIDDSSRALEQQEGRFSHRRCAGGWRPWHGANANGSPGEPACVRFRYRVADNVGNEVIYGSRVVSQVVDEQRPTVAVIALGDAVKSASVDVTAEADDVGFGVATVKFEYRALGHGFASWETIGTVASPPYRSTWDTSSLRPGRYLVRALARDVAGNGAVSKPVVIDVEPPLEPPAPVATYDEQAAGGATAPAAPNGEAREDVDPGTRPDGGSGEDDALGEPPGDEIVDALPLPGTDRNELPSDTPDSDEPDAAASP